MTGSVETPGDVSANTPHPPPDASLGRLLPPFQAVYLAPTWTSGQPCEVLQRSFDRKTALIRASQWREGVQLFVEGLQFTHRAVWVPIIRLGLPWSGNTP